VTTTPVQAAREDIQVMGSNNYAETITDPGRAREVLADLNRLAVQGWEFKVLEFNPNTDRFAISLGRESNLPTLDGVEEGGTAIDGPTLSSKLGEATQAIDFGNGHVGLLYESDGLGYMAIPNAPGKNSGVELDLKNTEENPMNESSRIVRGTCVAQVSEARWWVPSLNQTVTSIDPPTADAEFIKNVAYRQCGKPGVQWDEHADIRSKYEGGWLCADHAELEHPRSEEEL
jgi:hypothetical protein